MPVAEQERQAAPTKPEPQDMAKAVEKAVFDALGRPTNLTKAKITNVWGDNWRVTLWCAKEKKTDCGSMVVSAEPLHCFFITMSPGGEMIESNPKIQRKYE